MPDHLLRGVAAKRARWSGRRGERAAGFARKSELFISRMQMVQFQLGIWCSSARGGHQFLESPSEGSSKVHLQRHIALVTLLETRPKTTYQNKTQHLSNEPTLPSAETDC